MASWWKQIAVAQGALASSTGPWPKHVAFKLGAQNLNGLTWQAKLAARQSFGGSGAWGRRLTSFAGGQIRKTAYGTAGSWGRQIANQNLIGNAVPGGNHAITVPVGAIGAHG